MAVQGGGWTGIGFQAVEPSGEAASDTGPPLEASMAEWDSNRTWPQPSGGLISQGPQSGGGGGWITVLGVCFAFLIPHIVHF